MSKERLDSVKESIADRGIFIPTRLFGGLTLKELNSVLPRKCSLCLSLKHTKQNCPLELGYGYLELFRGVMLNDNSYYGDVNLREKYGWGDGDGYIEKGYKQSFTTSPMVAALFALSPKNTTLHDVNNLDEYAERAGVMNGFGITFPAETWLRQNVEKAYFAYRRNPYLITTDTNGNTEQKLRKVPIIFRSIVKATKENMENTDIRDMNYQGQYALEQEFHTDDALKLTHIGVPYHCYDFGQWILWAKYEDIPSEVFESATRLYDWMIEEAYVEDDENDIYDDLPVNAKSSKDEFGAMWWPLKVPVLVQEQLGMDDDALDGVRESNNAWDYFFKTIPQWESYRLSRFNQLKRYLKERKGLQNGKSVFYRRGQPIKSKAQYAYAIARFNWSLQAESFNFVESLENPYFEDYKKWLRKNKGHKKWINDEFIDTLTYEQFQENYSSFPNPFWS